MERITRKAVLQMAKALGIPVLKVGHCELQTLLWGLEPFGRAEECACDFYRLGECIVSTGYAPIGEPVAYEILKKYEQMAQKIKSEKDWESWGRELNALRKDFENEVLAN